MPEDALAGPPCFTGVEVPVGPDVGPVTVRMSWSLTLAPGRRGDELRQDLFLLWPAELVPPPGGGGSGDPSLRAFVEGRGFVVLSEGRLPLHSRDRAIHSQAVGLGAPPLNMA